MAPAAQAFREPSRAGRPRSALINRARILGPWPWMLAGTCTVLILIAGALLASCAGPRVDAVERKAETVREQLEDVRAELQAADGGSAEADELRAQLEQLRTQLVQLEAERAKAVVGDTKDAGADLLWNLADVVLLGGAGAYAYRRRSKSREAELSELYAQLEQLEDDVDELGRLATGRAPSSNGTAPSS